MYFFLRYHPNITHAFAQITTDGDEWVNGYIFFLLNPTCSTAIVYAIILFPLPPLTLFPFPILFAPNIYILVAKINEIWHMAVEAYSHDDFCCMCVSCVFCVKHAVGLFDLDWYQQRSHTIIHI